MEECAAGMGQRSSDAASMDAQNMPNKEENALSTGQRSNDAASMDVLIKSNEEECAGDMEHIAILMTNLLHSLCMGQRMMKRL